MNFVRTLTVSMLVLCGAVLATAKDKAPASKPASKPAASTSAGKMPLGYWSIMASELKLQGDQLAKLKEKVDAENKALEPYKKNLESATKAAADAKESKDKALMQTAAADVKATQDQMDKIRASTMDDVMTILTPEQREQWKSFELYRSTKQHLAKVPDFTPEQDAKIRQMATEQGKKIVDLKNDQKAINDLEASFLASVKEKVLNDAQRKALEALSQPKSKPADTPKKK